MEVWKGKVAVVTGASAGIGEALCKDLCKYDIQVVGLARRLDRLNNLKSEIEASNNKAKFHGVKCDLTKEEDIKNAFDEVITKFGGVDILVNNAGVIGNCSILEDDSDETNLKIIQTNVIGLISCTKKAYKSMVSRDVPGYIINISSIAGHSIPNLGPMKPFLGVYPSSKYAITALNQVIRSELNYYKKNQIRMSNVSPGGVRTEITEAAGLEFKFTDEIPMLKSEDVSDAVLYLLGTPARVQVQDIIIKAAGEA